MRGAIFVAVVAAHLILFLLFPSLWRRAARLQDEVPAPVPIFLPPWIAVTPVRKQQPNAQRWHAPLPYRGARSPGGRTAPQTRQSPLEHQASEEEESAERAPDSQQLQPAPISPAPDWRAQAEELAQRSAQHIVEAEDTAKRQANALTARFIPLAPDRLRGPEFGWSPMTHRISPMPGGGFAYSLNDHCQLMIFPLPFVGCAVGKIEANGDLFKYMHRPVKLGDWDKRDADP